MCQQQKMAHKKMASNCGHIEVIEAKLDCMQLTIYKENGSVSRT